MGTVDLQALIEARKKLLSLNMGSSETFNKTLESMKSITKIPTGISELDEALGGGIRPGVTTIGAITTAGKTTLSLQIAHNINKLGSQVIYYSNDASVEYLFAKNLSRCSYNLFKEKGFDTETIIKMLSTNDYSNNLELQRVLSEYQASAKNIRFIDYSANTELPELPELSDSNELDFLKNSINLYKYHGIETVVIIDYLQNLATNGSADIRINISDNINILMNIANTYKLPIIVISSISRSYYNQELTLAALKETGQIEYSSEIVIGLQYKDVSKADFDFKKAMNRPLREMELVILKNKLGSAGNKIRLDFIPKFNIFVSSDSAKGKNRRTTKDYFK